MQRQRVSNFAERVAKALYLRKMKQVELCSITGIPKSAMSQYINGKFEPKQDRLEAIASALNVSEAWLMGYGFDMNREEPANPSFLLSQAGTNYETGGGHGTLVRLQQTAAELTEENQKQLLKYADFLLKTQ